MAIGNANNYVNELSLNERIHRVMRRGDLLSGIEGAELRETLSGLCGDREVVLTASREEALRLMFANCIPEGNVAVSVMDQSLAASVEIAGGDPVLVDVDSEMQISVAELESLVGIAAVIVSHSAGVVSSRIGELKVLCEARGWLLVEDVSDNVGEAGKGASVGSYGDVVVLGDMTHGAFITGRYNLAKAVRVARNSAVNDLSAAVALDSVRTKVAFSSIHNANANLLAELLGEVATLGPRGRVVGDWLAVLVPEASTISDELNSVGINSYALGYSAELMKYPTAKYLYSRVIELPIGDNVSGRDIAEIARQLIKAIARQSYATGRSYRKWFTAVGEYLNHSAYAIEIETERARASKVLHVIPEDGEDGERKLCVSDFVRVANECKNLGITDAVVYVEHLGRCANEGVVNEVRKCLSEAGFDYVVSPFSEIYGEWGDGPGIYVGANGEMYSAGEMVGLVKNWRNYDAVMAAVEEPVHEEQKGLLSVSPYNFSNGDRNSLSLDAFVNTLACLPTESSVVFSGNFWRNPEWHKMADHLILSGVRFKVMIDGLIDDLDLSSDDKYQLLRAESVMVEFDPRTDAGNFDDGAAMIERLIENATELGAIGLAPEITIMSWVDEDAVLGDLASFCRGLRANGFDKIRLTCDVTTAQASSVVWWLGWSSLEVRILNTDDLPRRCAMASDTLDLRSDGRVLRCGEEIGNSQETHPAKFIGSTVDLRAINCAQCDACCSAWCPAIVTR